MKLAYPNPLLDDGTVALRPWSSSDLRCIEEASRDPEIPNGTTVPRTYSEEEGLAFIQRQHGRLTNGEGMIQAITDAPSDRALGLLGLFLRHPPAGPRVAGIGYWLVESARGRGVATRAVRLVVPWALRELGLHRIEAPVEPDNVASQRVLEKAGFKREGVLRSYFLLREGQPPTDAFMYSIVPGDLTQ